MLARCLLLSVAIFAIAVDASAQGRIAAREILTGETHYFFALSPNGKMLANVSTDSIRTEIRIRDVETLEITQRILFPEGIINDLVWTNNRRILLGTNDGLYSISPTGNSVQPILEGRGEENDRLFGESVFQDDLEAWRFRNRLKDDYENVLIESFDGYGFSRLHELNLFTGVMSDVVSGRETEVKRWHLTPGGKPVMGRRGKRSSFQYLVQDAATGEWRDHKALFPNSPVSLSYEDGPRYSRKFAPFNISEDGHTVFLTTLNNEGRYELISYDLRTDSIGGTVATDARYDVGTDISSTYLYYDDTDYEMVGSSHESVVRTYDLTNDVLSQAMTAVTQLLPATTNTLYSWSKDFKYLVIRAESPVLFSNWYRYAPQTNELTLIEASRAIDDSLMVPSASAGQVTGDDGTLIDTILLLPHPNAIPRGLVIAMQTNPTRRRYFEWDSDVYYLASRGYTVVQFNGRGSGGYGHDFLYAGLSNGLANMVNDAVTVTRWAEAQGLASDKGTFAFGWGDGALLALTTAIRHPDLFDAMVTYRAPMDLVGQKKWAAKEDRDALSTYLQTIEDRSGGINNVLSQLSPANNLDHIKTPWQVFHQEDDPIVDGDDMKKLIQKLQKTNDDIVFRNIGTGQSIDGSDDLRELFLELTVKFYARHTDTGGAIALD